MAVKPNTGAADPLAFCAGKVICGGWLNGGRLEPLSPVSPLHLPLALPLQLGLFDAGLVNVILLKDKIDFLARIFIIGVF